VMEWIRLASEVLISRTIGSGDTTLFALLGTEVGLFSG
jgi:hypothetical protein